MILQQKGGITMWNSIKIVNELNNKHNVWRKKHPYVLVM